MRNDPFVQYVYHFPYPKNSIDVRDMQPEDEEFIENTLKSSEVDPMYLSADDFFIIKTVIKMCKEHLPEKLI